MTDEKGKNANNGNKVKGGKHVYPILENLGYNVGKAIGSGSYAVVRYGTSSKIEGGLAIKIISKRTNAETYLNKFLQRELLVVSKVNHENVIEFYQSVETNNRVYIVMAIAPCGDLLKVIKHEGYLKEAAVGFWFRQCMNAVEYCHNMDIVHRDLKCEHLLLDAKCNVKLADFGFARFYKENDTVNTFCGSFAYSAPEILRIKPHCPLKADIWSCGIILFVMLTGLMPYDHHSRNKLIEQTQRQPIYPSDPKVHIHARKLIESILQPEKKRATIKEIKSNNWMVDHDTTRQECLATLKKKIDTMDEKQFIYPDSHEDEKDKQPTVKRTNA